MKELHNGPLTKLVRRLLLRRFVPSAIVIAVLALFLLCIIVMKAASGPFVAKDIPGYAFLALLLLGSVSVTGIAIHQMQLYLSLLSSSPKKTKLGFPDYSRGGKALRTLELLDESEQILGAYQIIACTPEDLKEYPQLCEFDSYMKEEKGTERAIFARANYVLLAYRHKQSKS
ncbi:MAG: hypothetical protein K2X77_05730 [Candidatus Obscuribacterales bacterium]|nr:hypothetical protein [Candidatus Obscuribacterales bacterium]